MWLVSRECHAYWELRTVVCVEWMGVWSPCQVNVRNKSYSTWRWFSDNSGFQQVDEKLDYPNSVAVTGVLSGVKQTREDYLISQSITGFEIVYRCRFFSRLFEMISVNRSDVRMHKLMWNSWQFSWCREGPIGNTSMSILSRSQFLKTLSRCLPTGSTELFLTSFPLCVCI